MIFTHVRPAFRHALLLAALIGIHPASATPAEDASFAAASSAAAITATSGPIHPAGGSEPLSFADAARDGRDDGAERAGGRGAAASAIPEPGSAALMLAGVALIALYRVPRRRVAR